MYQVPGTAGLERFRNYITAVKMKKFFENPSGIWKGFSRPNEVQWVGGYIKYMALEFLEICLEFFF